MNNLPADVKTNLENMKTSILERLDDLKKEALSDITINEFDIDQALLDTPKLYSKWLSYHTDETMKLKELFNLKEKVKLERWKYYYGKQTDKYIAKYGLVHEKILKTDLDKYLAADEKNIMVNDIVSAQKALTDYVEKILKEIGSRGFHCKSIIDWRRFVNGG
jgi:hypothetical protein